MLRLGLQWVGVALLVAAALVGFTALLVRLTPPPPAAIDLQVPIESVALPLDANGVGEQVLRDAMLVVRLTPYPPHAGAPSVLDVVIIDRLTQQPRAITPTLQVAPLEEAEGTLFPFTRLPQGGYRARGVFFPHPGEWRVRLRLRFGNSAEDSYSALMVVRAE